LTPISRWLSRLLSRGQETRSIPPDAALTSLRYVVVDTELTSLERRSNRILSIGAIAMDGTRICLGEQFYRVTNPGVAVPAETILIHGLRPVDVLQGMSPSAAVAEFLKFAQGAVLVGHFVGIDLAALKKELPAGAAILPNLAVDTYRIQRWLDLRSKAHEGDRGHQTEAVDLASLARRYGLEATQAHHALSDALLTAELWQRLIHELEAARLRTLRQVLRIGKPVG
jgi:DNA polymerase III subunit epsilon